MTAREEMGPVRFRPGQSPSNTPYAQAADMSLLRTTARSLHTARRLLVGGAVALTTLTGCADAPLTAPERALTPTAQPQHGLLENLVSASVLTRLVPLGTTYRASAVIGSAGGRVHLPQTGLTLTVPAGAVSGPTTFTVTAPAGAGVWYEFGPSGARFAKPLTVTQDVRFTALSALTALSSLTARFAPPALEAGYFVDGTQDDATGTAVVQEFLPVTLDTKRLEVRFQVNHFSGYMVSTGRRGSLSDD